MDGFDFVEVTNMIDASELSADIKLGLKTALDTARDNPAVLETVLGQVKAALGL